MYDFFNSLAVALLVITFCLGVGVPIGYWYVTRVVFPLFDITH